MYYSSESKLDKSWSQQNTRQRLWRGEEEAQEQLEFVFQHVVVFSTLASSRGGLRRRQQMLVARVVAGGPEHIFIEGKTYVPCWFFFPSFFSLVFFSQSENRGLPVEVESSISHISFHQYTHVVRVIQIDEMNHKTNWSRDFPPFKQQMFMIPSIFHLNHTLFCLQSFHL